jgi:hypothetical protein
MAQSPVAGVYDEAINRESAAEVLADRAKRKQAEAERATESKPKPRASSRQSVGEAATKSLVRTIANQLGREIVRGILGGFRR